MATTLYPKRKHLTVIEKGANVYFRVQINKLKLGLKVNKTFSDYGQAVEFLEACLNKLASKHVKTMLVRGNGQKDQKNQITEKIRNGSDDINMNHCIPVSIRVRPNMRVSTAVHLFHLD